MALITFLSDFGSTDHYVAAVKAAISSVNTQQQIVDISHSIRPYDISHGAHVLKHSFRLFPESTIHIVAIDAVKEISKPVAIRLEGHYFLGFDTGLFSLISDQKPDVIQALSSSGGTFPAKDLFAPIALSLAKGEKLESIGSPLEALKQLMARQLKVTKREIVGNVVSVDHFGNLITNIAKEDFDKMLHLNGAEARYLVRFGREQFDHFHKHFAEVDSGDCFVLFNSFNELQIGINKGNASELLGLNIDAPVAIEFIN